MQEGEILIVNPGEVHRCRFGLDRAKSCGVTLIVRGAALRSVLDTVGFRSPSNELLFKGKVRNRDAFGLASTLVQEFEQARPGYVTMMESIVPQVLVHLFRSWPAERVRPCDLHLPPQLPWLQMHRATEYMNSHGKATFRFSDLCMDVGVSPSRFIPLFKNSSWSKSAHLLQFATGFQGPKVVAITGIINQGSCLCAWVPKCQPFLQSVSSGNRYDTQSRQRVHRQPAGPTDRECPVTYRRPGVKLHGFINLRET